MCEGEDNYCGRTPEEMKAEMSREVTAEEEKQRAEYHMATEGWKTEELRDWCRNLTGVAGKNKLDAYNRMVKAEVWDIVLQSKKDEAVANDAELARQKYHREGNRASKREHRSRSTRKEYDNRGKRHYDSVIDIGEVDAEKNPGKTDERISRRRKRYR